MRRLVECIPNFSEGGRKEVVQTIVKCIESAGVTILDEEMDADHNRCVISFVGSPENVVQASFNGISKAVELIDLNKHEGEHPRIGAADVVPFVPISGVSMDECVALARELGKLVWERLRVPVYFYEHAATRPERKALPELRKGEFEGLREDVKTNPDRAPDVGERELHPTAGATVIGAPAPLIAFNVNLNTQDIKVAKAIAKRIRERDGGMPGVRALGFELKEKNCVQVSMNLVDFHKTNMAEAYAKIVELATKEFNVGILESEVIGLVPMEAVNNSFVSLIRAVGFKHSQILELRIDEKAKLHQIRLDEFVSHLASSDPTPGGGSASALALALGAGLMKMVALHTNAKGSAKMDTIHIDDILARAQTKIQEDADSFDRVMRAFKLPKSTDEEKAARRTEISASFKAAADVPLSVMRDVVASGKILIRIVEVCETSVLSDVTVAAHMLNAAFYGADANVRINARSLKEEGRDYLTISTALGEEWGPIYRKTLASIWWRENEK
jgi:glutamate formiminotransferase/formiminotetrahydrofolate cyclodeaminase